MKAPYLLTIAAVAGCIGCGPSTQSREDTRPVPEPDVVPTLSAKKTAVELFSEECAQGLHQAQEELPGLLAVGGVRTVENFLEPYNLMLMHLEHSIATAGLMDGVHPDEAIRKAAQNCEQEAARFATELSLHRGLYEAFSSVDTKDFDDNTRRLVEKTLKNYRRAGVDKDEATRKRLTEIEEELVKQGQAFAQNIVDDVRKIELDSVDQLKGMPADYIAAHPPNEQGKIVITTNYPDYIPLMGYADNDDVRKQLYIASKSRADKSNGEVLRTILSLRAEKAKILGYSNWADYATEDKMMGSGKNAADFLTRISKMAQKRSDKDYKELLTWKKKHMDKKATSVGDWQKTYIETKVKAESYSFDPQEVRPYLAYEDVQKGLLDITSKIYDIQYEPAADAKLWHEDVDAFDVMRNGNKIGRIYLDMHPRDGKYGHAAQFTYRSGVKGEQLPEGVLVCNFPNPRTSEGPALMEHGDVTTMFHEFGHLMHHVLGGQQKWIEQSGVATEWDFVEAPSQMFEEWAWDYQTLSTFAKNRETGEVIPEEMVARMRKADKFGLGVQTMQQMFYAAVSLEFYRAAPATLDMTAMVKDLQKKYTPFAFVEGTNFQANFGHLNGYSAIYYTYMWSLVIAKDLLTPFLEHGQMNSDWTYAYRDKVLTVGGTKDAADLVADFLGRPYNFKAFEAFLTK